MFPAAFNDGALLRNRYTTPLGVPGAGCPDNATVRSVIAEAKLLQDIAIATAHAAASKRVCSFVIMRQSFDC
jgi:hypothetical protein